MMEDGRVEDHITSNEYESDDEDCSDGMLLEERCDGDESVGHRFMMENTGLDQPSLVGSNVFVDGNSDPTVMHAFSEHRRLLSTQPSVNYNSKSLHDHVSKKDVEINLDNHVIAAANFQAVEPSKNLEHHDSICYTGLRHETTQVKEKLVPHNHAHVKEIHASDPTCSNFRNDHPLQTVEYEAHAKIPHHMKEHHNNNKE
ncbi:hypothetical protein L2E82_49038 [Cichorium intybus]|uniref:Uncharacterized protein n=1 Tax=Cichorium intybus TaxID=13427 RepID=A0ACB8YZ67_CICIN|nr:hypothetical protein L2E82_49038 [Cichorium intybus]